MLEKSFGLTVRAIVCDEQGRCLLLRRSAANVHFAGCWEWPGGKLDAGEDFIAGLRRELFEETGLSMDPIRFTGATSFDLSDRQIIVLCMETVVTGGMLHLSDEHDAVEWVPFAEFGHYDFSEPMRDFMMRYAQHEQ